MTGVCLWQQSLVMTGVCLAAVSSDDWCMYVAAVSICTLMMYFEKLLMFI